MTASIQIHGKCDSKFDSVKDVFLENFRKRGDVGAAVCVYLQGKPVIDLWGGYADAARSRPWERDTIVTVASTTKGMVATCAHLLVERGQLDLDLPVAHYWPAFAQKGKENIPVRWLLSHRSGLPGVRQDMPPESLYDWNRYAAAIAETEPWWEPGSKHGYHALTYGFLVGEVIRRVSGQSVGQFFRNEISGPLNADFFIGVPEDQDHRAAEVIPGPIPDLEESPILAKILEDREGMTARAFINPPRQPDVFNTRAWRAAEIPSSNGHTTAWALARIYSMLAQGGVLDGLSILKSQTIENAIVEQSSGPDAILVYPNRFALGFGLSSELRPFGSNERAFGHSGQGGSTGFADLDAQVSFGYVMNQFLSPTVQAPDLRWPALANAVFDCLM